MVQPNQGTLLVISGAMELLLEDSYQSLGPHPHPLSQIIYNGSLYLPGRDHPRTPQESNFFSRP
jgi:hypothetical protein